MGFFDFWRKDKTANVESVRMMVSDRDNYFSFGSRLYRSDQVMACVRPMVSAVGKMVAKHIRTKEEKNKDGKMVREIEQNPDAYMRMLLREPNPYMTGQGLQERMALQLILNNNAFALIVRDPAGLPMQIYPVPCTSVRGIKGTAEIKLEFTFRDGSRMFASYDDVIHLSRDCVDSYLFGESPMAMLSQVMDTVSVIDQGIVNAIKNSSVIRWLLKIKSAARPEDITKTAKDFADSFLSYDTKSLGVAAIDQKTDAERIDPKDYVPNALVQDRVSERIMSFFNVNKNIVQSTATEEEWNAYFEQVIEPVGIKLSEAFTRRLFSRRQRGFGNEIVFEAANLQHASVKTKLGMLAMVDRGALTPNEWRAIFNWAPIPGGDVPVRRADTPQVTEEESDDENNQD